MDDSELLLRHLGSSYRFEHIELRRLTTDRVRSFGSVETAETYSLTAPYMPVADGLISEAIFGAGPGASDRFGRIDLPSPIEHPFAPDGRWLLDFVLVLPLAFRCVELNGSAVSQDSITGLYVKVVARRNRLRHLLANPPSEEDMRTRMLAHERATLAKWIQVLFHNTRGVSEDLTPRARVGLLDRLGSSRDEILDRLVAFDHAVGAERQAVPTVQETRCVLVSLGFEVTAKAT
ncbi:MAG TPA: hypothetical protein VMJ10_31395 [Kofleriaceae bacterium]|nr:hypothetical protein [Kofleriaceae bacterium]